MPAFQVSREHSNSDYPKSSLTYISEYQKLIEAPGGDETNRKKMEPTNWAPEHSAALRDYLASGMSYAEIVQGINASAGARPADGPCREPAPWRRCRAAI
jgi:hypothetical protein